jgi:hypothetical protein
MNGSPCDIDRLLLAVSGALDGSEERRLARHLGDCRSCAEEIEELRGLAAELSRIPTPRPTSGLVERVRRAVHLDLAGRADERLNRLVLVFLLVLSWTMTLMGFAGVRLVTGGSGEILSLIRGGGLSLSAWSVAYLASAWLGGAAALVFIGLDRRRSTRSGFFGRTV